jgi:hypothetical protein
VVLGELDEAAARDLADEYLAGMQPPGSDVWIITRVQTAEWGWVIYWANRRATHFVWDDERAYAVTGG